MSIIDYFAMNVVPKMYRGKGALHPAATGELGFGVRCVREYDVNIEVEIGRASCRERV